MSRPDSSVLGEFHADLLDQIAQTGSITHAAKACGISYRTAWSHVDRLNELSGRPVVERTAGGKSGGGTHLTVYGAGLLKAYRILQEKHARYVEGLREGITDFEGFQRIARGMSLRTSARNQLFAKVEKVTLSGLEAEVVLALRGGVRLVSRITRRSARDLGIRKGGEVYALIKANSVELVPAKSTPVKSGPAKSQTPKSAPSNVFPGVFEEVHQEGGRIEVSVRLPGGEVLWATHAGKLPRGLRLEKGHPVDARIDPAQVILGVTDVPRF